MFKVKQMFLFFFMSIEVNIKRFDDIKTEIFRIRYSAQL